MPPVARVRRAPRHESTTVFGSKQGRASSFAVTSPFRKTSAPVRDSVEKFGPYMIYEQLGEGGMARVHRAELQCAEGVKKTVALKRMHTALSEDADFVDAFVREAQIASRLRHPNIAQAFELGKISGTYFIAMEMVPGPTLAQIMRQSRHAAGAIPLAIVLEVLIQLCDALEAVHDLRDDAGQPLQLIHRDISPANIILSRTGIAKLIDFGIAKHRSARMSTEAGIIKGKHAYLAPEYTYGQLDHRADLFAVGIIAHEMLSGRRLFLGDTELDSIRAVRERHIHPPSRFNSQVPRDLDAIIMTALSRDPEHRWQNAGAMRAALVTLVRELNLVVKGRVIRDWIEWAFQQPDRASTPIQRMLDTLEPSISIEDEDLLDELESTDDEDEGQRESYVVDVPAPVIRPLTVPPVIRRPMTALVPPEIRRPTTVPARPVAVFAIGSGPTPQDPRSPAKSGGPKSGQTTGAANGDRAADCGVSVPICRIDPYVLQRAQAVALQFLPMRPSPPRIGAAMVARHVAKPASRSQTQVIDRRPRGVTVLLALVAVTLHFDLLDLSRCLAYLSQL